MSRNLLDRLLGAPPSQNRGLALIGLGLTVVAAAAGIAYFWWRGTPSFGLAVGLLILAAGLWEYRLKATELHEEEKASADAERRRRRNRE